MMRSFIVKLFINLVVLAGAMLVYLKLLERSNWLAFFVPLFLVGGLGYLLGRAADFSQTNYSVPKILSHSLGWALLWGMATPLLFVCTGEFNFVKAWAILLLVPELLVYSMVFGGVLNLAMFSAK